MNIYFVSLGCDKNLVDSQTMIDLFERRGHRIVGDLEDADAAIVNTCCFIDSAKEESIEAVFDMVRAKEDGLIRAVVMAGCMAERFREEIRQEIPEVDALIDTHSIMQACEIIEQTLPEETLDNSHRSDRDHTGSAAITTPGHYAFLKIAEGCDKHCTYCVIPSIRGPYRSIPFDDILEEARKKEEAGAKELILIAQETTLYGVDLYGEKRLVPLLERLCELPGIQWIRLLYCYPEEVDDDLIECMALHPKICHYIDLPIQHANDRILKRMGRRTDQAQIKAVVEKLRKSMPDIAVRTTLITGFPGETEREHRELVDFVREMRFDRLGVFAYSREDGTPAAAFDDQIDEEVKKARLEELYEVQKDIAEQKNASLTGSTIDVMVEGSLADSRQTYAGRTYRDAPDVDGLVFVNSDKDLESGDMISVTITGSNGYDLIAAT